MPVGDREQGLEALRQPFETRPWRVEDRPERRLIVVGQPLSSPVTSVSVEMPRRQSVTRERPARSATRSRDTPSNPCSVRTAAVASRSSSSTACIIQVAELQHLCFTRLVNANHRDLCSSDEWSDYMRDELLPWVLGDRDLGEDVLEVGPGPGVTTELLRPRSKRLTVVEADPEAAEGLHQRFDGTNVTVVHADGAAMPFPTGRFSAAIALTMLHHVPTVAAQDALFAEVCRVLRPGGVAAGRGLHGRPRIPRVPRGRRVRSPRPRDARGPSADGGVRRSRSRAGRPRRSLRGGQAMKAPGKE